MTVRPGLHAALEAAGIALDHHESDLYVRDSQKARIILRDYGVTKPEVFLSNGIAWIDVPFAYAPWWEAKSRNREAWERDRARRNPDEEVELRFPTASGIPARGVPIKAIEEERSRATMHDRVRQLGITIVNKPAAPDARAASQYPGGSHWRSTLFRRGRQNGLTVVFHQGSAHKQPPTAADVLNALALDASGYENASDFDDYASEYGMPMDTAAERREARKLYAAVEREREKLKEFLSPAEYESILYDTESL